MLPVYYYDNFSIPGIDQFLERANDIKFRYYISELMNRLTNTPGFEMDFAIRKAITICRLANIPVNEHFKLVFRSEEGCVSRDWKLSDLACCIIIISSNSTDKYIKDIQEQLLAYIGL
jgi:hypothetical protein